jgi:hypothetical protein
MSTLTCHYFRSSFFQSDGLEVEWEIKAWNHVKECGFSKVLWELVGVTDGLGVVSDKQRSASKWFLERLGVLSEYWRRLGILDADAYIPNIKAQTEKARRNNIVFILREFSHDEFALSTKGLLGMLLALSTSLKTCSAKERCSFLLASFLLKLLPGDILGHRWASDAIDGGV